MGAAAAHAGARDFMQQGRGGEGQGGRRHLEPERPARPHRVEPAAGRRAQRLRGLGDGAHPAIPARVLRGAARAVQGDPEEGAIGPRHEGAPRPQRGLGGRHRPEALRARVEKPSRHEEGGAHEERPAIAHPIGQVSRGELEEHHGQPEDGLEDHDVGERHPDLILPEKGDDRDGEEDELEGGEGDEKPDISHAGREVSRASPRRSG